MDAMVEHDLRAVLKAARAKTIHDRPLEEPLERRRLTTLEWRLLRSAVSGISPDLLESYRRLQPDAKARIKNFSRIEAQLSAPHPPSQAISLLRAAAALRITGQDEKEVSEFVGWSAHSGSVFLYSLHLVSFDHWEPDVDPADERVDLGGRRKNEWWTQSREQALLTHYFTRKQEGVRVKTIVGEWLTASTPEDHKQCPEVLLGADGSDRGDKALKRRLKSLLKLHAEQEQERTEQERVEQERWEKLLDEFDEE